MAAEKTTLTEIEMLKIALSDEERQPCEVWTRVMGYHRPVVSFNQGKQGEYAERVCFVESGELAN
ncbi:MAG: anaerobic ribonucleoside-triphosphate reductase [Coriobacteriia bacterium]|nr:anaerobic ribonucleoside-triphosphate reductase [Coriobacteriia bacterium]